MSRELKDFLPGKGIASSRTTSYNPQGNGQAERFNASIWKNITAALMSRCLPTRCWQVVLPDALHSIRSLLCTATNETPHERLFKYARRSSSGSAVPSWLSTPGLVLLKRHVRSSKTDPLVDEVELLQANPHYAHIRYPSGKEDTVATKHLAPAGILPFEHQKPETGDLHPLSPALGNSEACSRSGVRPVAPNDTLVTVSVDPSAPEATTSSPQEDAIEEAPAPRRSGRIRRPPTRFESS